MQIRTLGPFHLLEQIGRGGMASVHKAYDPGQDRYVAVKVMYPTMGGADGQFIKRFRREAEVVMKLKHPHIVPVESFGEQDGLVYLVMPLLKVGSLADRLQKGALSPAEGARVFDQVSQALQLAHDQGVVHRDVKPSNILLDEHGNALLSDFGLAQIHDASVSLTGSALLGTPAYMSPEQARGGTVDARSDQYSLGVILYQLSTGELPFEAETPMAVLMRHINEPLPPARTVSPSVPPAVERVILKATAKLPEERFASVAEFNQAFQAALAHARDPHAFPEPKIKVPPSSMSIHVSQMQLQPPRRRGRRLAAALAVLLLLLACPATANGLRDLIDRSASPAEGALLMEGMNDPQLTALAGTIEAMSTQLALSGGGTLSAEDIPTMVMATLVADSTDGPPTATPARDITLAPLSTSAAASTATTGPSPTPSRTSTPGPSPTPSRTPTRTPTSTPGPSPTPSITPTSSSTPNTVPSPTPSQTIPASPTTGVSPTVSPTTVAASTASPTATEPAAVVPTVPLPTPTVPVCSQLSLGSFSVTGQELKIEVINNSWVDIRIVGLHLDWPSPNEELKKIELGGDTIWDAGDGIPPSDIPAESGWKGAPSKREVNDHDSEVLRFFFGQDALPGPYALGLFFEGPWNCTLTRNN